ncbi:hypothetical protein FRC03_010562 [Tulasnella sp. 419]|nr:hypothetical protein FRC03_010562 [Tulasnella sp. 419]
MPQPSYPPIDELPLELLHEIFIFYCRVPPSPSPIIQYSGGTRVDEEWGPLTLSHVSGRWRDIARQLRPIWSFIRIMDNTPLAKTSLWVRLSVNHPLDIAIHLNHNLDMPRAYRLLVSHANRWRQFRINAYKAQQYLLYPETWFVVPFLRSRDGFNWGPGPIVSAPELTVLDLQSPTSQVESPNEPREQYYPSLWCPKLQTLVVKTIPLSWNNLAMHTPLKGIKNIEVDQELYGEQDLVGSMAAIGQMKALRHAVISVTVHSSYNPVAVSSTSPRLMDLPGLQKLRLSFTAQCSTSWLWIKNFHAPGLEYLNLSLNKLNNRSGSGVWHEEHEQTRLKGVIPSLTLRMLHLALKTGNQCAKCIAAFMATVSTVSRITLYLDGKEKEHLLKRVLAFKCTFPQLSQVVVLTRRSRLSRENEALLSSEIARWNPDATVTYVLTPSYLERADISSQALRLPQTT